MDITTLIRLCRLHLAPFLPGHDWEASLAPLERDEPVAVTFFNASGKVKGTLLLMGNLRVLVPRCQVVAATTDPVALEETMPMVDVARKLVGDLKKEAAAQPS